MQLRCTYCQTMFAISHEEMLAGLEHMEEEKLKYYDAHCPKCRRANRVERFKMEMAYPNWRTDLKTMAKQSAAPTEKAVKTPAPASAKAKSGTVSVSTASKTSNKTPGTSSAKGKAESAKKGPAVVKKAPAKKTLEKPAATKKK